MYKSKTMVTILNTIISALINNDEGILRTSYDFIKGYYLKWPSEFYNDSDDFREEKWFEKLLKVLFCFKI